MSFFQMIFIADYTDRAQITFSSEKSKKIVQKVINISHRSVSLFSCTFFTLFPAHHCFKTSQHLHVLSLAAHPKCEKMVLSQNVAENTFHFASVKRLFKLGFTTFRAFITVCIKNFLQIYHNNFHENGTEASIIQPEILLLTHQSTDFSDVLRTLLDLLCNGNLTELYVAKI